MQGQNNDFQEEEKILDEQEIDEDFDDACPYGMCDGSGEIPTDERDSDGNWARGVGTQKCLCKVKEPDYEPEQE